jgi:hypothetical protein
MALAGVAMGEMKAKDPASVAGSMRARGCLPGKGVGGGGGGGVCVCVLVLVCCSGKFCSNPNSNPTCTERHVPSQVHGDAAEWGKHDVGAGDVRDEVGDEDHHLSMHI